MDSDMKWILALGGLGIVTGLSTYGHVIMRGLGVKLAKLTPSRGFCAETSSSITVTFASAYGLPVSTTHCQVGSTSGIGLVENPRGGLNWKFLGRSFVGWVFTLIVCGHLSAAFYSQGAYAPNVYMVTDRVNYQDAIGNYALYSLQLLRTAYSSSWTSWTNDQQQAWLKADADNKLLNLAVIKDSSNLATPDCAKNMIVPSYDTSKYNTTTQGLYYIDGYTGTGAFNQTDCYYTPAAPCVNKVKSGVTYKCLDSFKESTYSAYKSIQYFKAKDEANVLQQLLDLQFSLSGKKLSDYSYSSIIKFQNS